MNVRDLVIELLLRRPVEPDAFCRTLGVTVDNNDLSDADFRQMVRNTLPVVRDSNYPLPQGKEA